MDAEGETVIETKHRQIERFFLGRDIQGGHDGLGYVIPADPIDLEKGGVEGDGVEPTTTDRVLEIRQVLRELTVVHVGQNLTESAGALFGRKDLTKREAVAHRQGQHFGEQADTLGLSNNVFGFEERDGARRNSLEELCCWACEALPAVGEVIGRGPLDETCGKGV
jgi:hypothetical protein